MRSKEEILKDIISFINNGNKKEQAAAASTKRRRESSIPKDVADVEGDATGGGRTTDKEHSLSETNNENVNTTSDPRSMSDAEKQKRGDMLRNAPTVHVGVGQIQSNETQSARAVAEKWWDDNVLEPLFYDTEAGIIEINKNSVQSSLAHGYSQSKLDAITSLPEGFKNAVYLGSMHDSRERGVMDHYFAYPIDYNGKRCYVFCRAMHDANKNSLYVHEVFLEDRIEMGDTLQTAASKPHGGISLYRDILANVLVPADKGTEKAETKQGKVEENAGGGEKSYKKGVAIMPAGNAFDELLDRYRRAADARERSAVAREMLSQDIDKEIAEREEGIANLKKQIDDARRRHAEEAKEAVVFNRGIDEQTKPLREEANKVSLEMGAMYGVTPESSAEDVKKAERKMQADVAANPNGITAQILKRRNELERQIDDLRRQKKETRNVTIGIAESSLQLQEEALAQLKEIKGGAGAVDGQENGERAEMRARITDWLSKDNLKKAEGKSRDEIFEEFGNEPLPIAYVPRKYLSLIGDNLNDEKIYCGKGYFLDHALRNHGSDGTQIPVEDVDVNQYLNIQSVLDNPDSVKEKYVDGKRTIIFIKKIGRFYAELTQVEEDGKIILHKSLFNQKKEPYAKLNDIRHSETSSEGGVSSISHVSELTPAISLESRGDVSEGTSSKGKVTENGGNVQGNEKENAVEGGNTVQQKVEAAEAETNTEPTQAQIEAGNYKKGHVTIGDFDITIENPKGSERKGVDADGKAVLYHRGEYARPNEGERAVGGYLMEMLQAMGIKVVADKGVGQSVLNEGGPVLTQRISTLKKAANAIRSWIKKKATNETFVLELPKATRDFIRKRTGLDIDNHVLAYNGIRHGLKNHGVNGKKLTEKSIPVRDEDAELIPYIMVAPDRVEKGSVDITGRESIRFIKTLSNGVIFVVEKENKENPNDMETINIWAVMPSSNVANAHAKHNPGATSEAVTISTEDAAKIKKDAETAIEKDNYLQ